ncbi:hypothetical protein QSV34_12980 [Porticoccus sp. W117]|uniref:hypothetical protein n=1 Tax=Porticoccus sp. W117 TaxID=3054777 RepID=UPI002593E827|nr:hypothetical protein [Porticoccus sp. W117]MDM3872262.1 hypothetical protein [Porticoccus sp. W117]
MKVIKILCTVAAVGSIAGCASKNLIYVQDASLGFTFGIGPEGTQKFSLGYDRDVYSVVPKKGKGEEAMSLFSINSVEIDGLDDMKITEFVAGGDPAKTLAEDPDAVNALRTKVYGK